MMLVGEDRDVRAVLQVVGDGERARRRDVVEADGAEGRGERETGLHDSVRVRGSQGEGEGIDPGEGLEDDALGFFKGMAASRPDSRPKSEPSVRMATVLPRQVRSNDARGSSLMARQASATPGV